MNLRPAFRFVIIGGALLAASLAQDQLLDEAARLDGEQKCQEAEQLYQRALDAGAPSPALLNNLGNHYLTCGSPEKARTNFESLLKRNPAHANANLQLARLAVARKEGAQALSYLSVLKSGDPEASLVRAEALAQTGKRQAASGVLNELLKSADPRLLFATGLTCGRIGFYDQAETAFTKVLASVPDDYDVLFNLGLAAAKAGHSDRARRAFEVALKVRPGDVDTLYELGRVEASLADYNRAIFLLAQARKAAPQRLDIILALARAAQSAAYYGDAILAYNEYLKAKPDDELVRRDWALLYGYSREGRQQGLEELQHYVDKHPNDAIGYYDLAQLMDRVDRSKALDLVTRAVRLNAKLEPARYFRAWLLQQLGRHQESLAELQAVVLQNPKNVRALDLIGLDYLYLEQPADAEKALRRAIALSPNQPEILFHLGRALKELGRPKEAQPFLEKFREARQQTATVPREDPGMIEAATLTATERTQRAIELLRETVRANPNDATAKLNLGSLLLAEGRLEQGTIVFRELLAMEPDPVVSQNAGTALLRYEQYPLARDFLLRSPSARLDLAIALYFTAGPPAALKLLEEIPSTEADNGDRLLLKAKILDTSGKSAQADRVINESLRYSISRPKLAEEAALLLLRHNQNQPALDLIGQALRSSPDDAALLLTRVVVFSSLDRNTAAETALKQIEARWPEWDRPYLLEGLLLERKSRLPEAKNKIQIALDLGTREPVAACALARMTGSPKPDCGCQPGIYERFFPCKSAAP